MIENFHKSDMDGNKHISIIMKMKMIKYILKLSIINFKQSKILR
jgi:hypothetical protein